MHPAISLPPLTLFRGRKCPWFCKFQWFWSSCYDCTRRCRWTVHCQSLLLFQLMYGAILHASCAEAGRELGRGGGTISTALSTVLPKGVRGHSRMVLCVTLWFSESSHHGLKPLLRQGKGLLQFFLVSACAVSSVFTSPLCVQHAFRSIAGIEDPISTFRWQMASSLDMRGYVYCVKMA